MQTTLSKHAGKPAGKICIHETEDEVSDRRSYGGGMNSSCLVAEP